VGIFVRSPSAAALTEKGVLELINWQGEDGTIYSPTPAGQLFGFICQP